MRYLPPVSTWWWRGGLRDSEFSSADHEFVLFFLLLLSTAWEASPQRQKIFVCTDNLPLPSPMGIIIDEIIVVLTLQPAWRSCSPSSPTSQLQFSPRSLAMALLRYISTRIYQQLCWIRPYIQGEEGEDWAHYEDPVEKEVCPKILYSIPSSILTLFG